MAEPGTLAEVEGVGVLARYGDRLPLTEATPRITLGEGNTPLVRAESLEAITGARVYLKLEFMNPTGSFKDRGMVVAVAKALEAGSEAVICASTGNTSASAAAYAGRYGLRCYVVVPKGNIAQGKLAQAIAHGARILAVDGSFDDALHLVQQVADRHPITLVNSVNPHRIAGQQTAAMEIVDALGDAPDLHCIPVGNAGNITAYWLGYVGAFQGEQATQKPRMFGFQAAGAAPLVHGEPVDHPETVATAIRVGRPASWDGAVRARDESAGEIRAVTDEEILAAYRRLAREEGVFCEPASAASVAGLLSLPAAGVDLAEKQVVCVITGSGLKDPETALTIAPDMIEIPNSLDAVEAALD
ncbi:MAG TPA: threonine synthase [Dehalococcoidia bacterium]|nr:threonine synthase [Dehalococcoidia bacterium]